jgi:hypothetical protein
MDKVIYELKDQFLLYLKMDSEKTISKNIENFKMFNRIFSPTIIQKYHTDRNGINDLF